MTDDISGVIRLDGPLRAVSFTRTFDVGHIDLWDALSQPDHLTRWFATVSGTFTEGGSLEIGFDPDDPQRTEGTIVECRPPRRLVVSWTFPGETESYVYVDVVEQDAGGTQLTLDHQRLPVAATAGYGARWQTYLERLAAHLAGDVSTGPTWDTRFAQLRPLYEAQMGRVL